MRPAPGPVPGPLGSLNQFQSLLAVGGIVTNKTLATNLVGNPTVVALRTRVGTPFVGSSIAPGKQASLLKPVRIGLWDRYGGSMPSGWTRWLLERFEFPFQVVYAPELDKGSLRQKFDVLIREGVGLRRAVDQDTVIIETGAQRNCQN